MSILILVTGGTFDKEYNEKDGGLFFRKTHLPEMLSLGRSVLDVSIRTLMLVDSLRMTDQQRRLILEKCQTSKVKQLVITHGTDTMVKTAGILAKARLAKTIVLTGAIIPYRLGSSDGLFNLGSAMAYVQTMPQGVYIAMNGRCFDWNNVKKNKKLCEFEELRRRTTKP